MPQSPALLIPRKNAVLLSDCFTGADATAIASHVPAPVNKLACSWSNASGTWTIVSNKAHCATVSGNNRAAALVNIARGGAIVSANLWTSGGVAGGIVLKWVDDSNWVIAVHNGTACQLAKKVAGSTSLLINTAVTYVDGAEIKVVMNDATYDLYYNGSKVGTTQTITESVFDNLQTVGIYGADTVVSLDNFIVIPLTVARTITMVEATPTYASSIDGATTLSHRTSYPFNGGASMPIIVCMHSWSADYDDFDSVTRIRLATAYGNCFFVSPNLRGRSPSTGSADGAGREIYDIIDAINYIKTNFASHVDATQIHLLGWSAGGGDGYALMSKFPDTFNSIVACFGISDYGYDVTNGWWYTNTTRQAALTTQIGDRAASALPYQARDAVLALANYTGGHLWIFQDASDSIVPIINSRNARDAMIAASLTNYSYYESKSGDAQRWLHGEPTIAQDPDIIPAELYFMPPIVAKTYPAWTVPASGTHTVIGYMVNKRYTIWLRAHGTTPYGLDATATVAYGGTANHYIVTPLSGAIDVTITQADAKTGSASNITTPTDITVS